MHAITATDSGVFIRVSKMGAKLPYKHPAMNQCEELSKDSSSFCGWGSEGIIGVFHIVPHNKTYGVDHSISPVQSHLTVGVWEREGKAEMQNSMIIHVKDFPAK